MSESDDTTILALAYLRNEAKLEQSTGRLFADIPRAPLARLIDAYLDQHPHLSTAALLRSIADLNQGRLEDLNVPVFISYLVDKCRTDEVMIRSVVNTLRTYDMVSNASPDSYDSELLIAARSESDEREGVSLDALREQLRKRIE